MVEEAGTTAGLSTDRRQVIVAGRFRSGTTMVWNAFRRQPGWRCYLEPLHEHLVAHVERRSQEVDPSHRAVANYWLEYGSIDIDRLRRLHQPWFAQHRFRMAADASADDLRDFLALLVGSAERTMLKLTRADFRLPWLRVQFPDALLLLLVRNPRDLWTSYLGRGALSEEAALAADGYGAFLGYHRAVMDDLGIDVPGHPYRRFFAHSLLSVVDAAGAVDAIVRYEDIVEDPNSWREQLDEQLGIPLPRPFVVDRLGLGARFHSAEWYADQERATIEGLLRLDLRLDRGRLDAAHAHLLGFDAAEPIADLMRRAG